MNFKYVAALVLLGALLFFADPASAQVLSYTKGDTVSISGTATGDPQQGLAVWVFGPNYWTRETEYVSGGMYTYEIDKSVTSDMAAGQYFCIIQHPMYNGVFDADLSAGGTSVVSSAGNSFIIDGPGKLMGSSAAQALKDMLDSPDIDDTYTSAEFLLSEPWIRFVPEETYSSGEKLLVSGNTNIAAGERLLYELTSASFEPSSKEKSFEFSGESGYVTVKSSYPDNTWEIYIDTAGMKPDLYMFKISREDGSAAYSAEFTLAEALFGEEKTFVPLSSPAESLLSETEQTPVNGMQTPPAAGMNGAFVLITLTFAVIVAFHAKKEA